MSRLLASILFVSSCVSQMGMAAIEVPEALRKIAGCFEVDYHYAEQGERVYPAYREQLTEYIDLKVDGDTVVLQHYGIVPILGPIKHWGEHWTLLADGRWHQEVIHPSGSQRYECDAPMTVTKSQRQWVAQRTCTYAGAPKPRRDVKLHRNDYDVLDRTSLVNITANAWHDVQTNVKRTRDGKVVAHETGWNEYRRVAEKKCQKAIDFARRQSE